jgi:hypothetical protein
MNHAEKHKLSEEENEAIDAALKASEEGQTYSHDEVMNAAKDKFPHLKFK